MRRIEHSYRDPLDQIWLTTARRIGLTIERGDDVYASTDGRATLRIGAAPTLDPDDSLAQMIFHELCHSLVEGPDSFARPDWGLDNTSSRDELREHACLRLQAHLAARHGLRQVLAPTTDYRAYWDRLPADPLAPRRDPAVTAAVLGAQRAGRPPWAPHLEVALAATAEVVARAAAFADDPASLFAAAEPAPAPHPSRLPPWRRNEGRRCGTCAWRTEAGLCRQADGAPVAADWDGCSRWEAALDCRDCGACCRAAYHSVTVDPQDPVVRLHSQFVVDRGSYLEIRRQGDRCAALEGGTSPDEPFTCAIYLGRPETCRDFELGSDNCLIARRRVGLSL
ncbi:MAG TPA: YkgJ family cysteine cluster protein [Kofleriaceae bacterium]|nr:YkgJ family cysteine cluster protein [Kofleriaceae bacterium]